MFFFLQNDDVISVSCDTDTVWPYAGVTLAENEVVTQLDVYRQAYGSSPIITAVALETNCGSYGPFGGTEYTVKTELKGYKLRGVFGRKGLIIDSPGVQFDVCLEENA